jgi:hypothetical protein
MEKNFLVFLYFHFFQRLKTFFIKTACFIYFISIHFHFKIIPFLKLLLQIDFLLFLEIIVLDILIDLFLTKNIKFRTKTEHFFDLHIFLNFSRLALYVHQSKMKLTLLDSYKIKTLNSIMNDSH